jgi:hypothetical protein
MLKEAASYICHTMLLTRNLLIVGRHKLSIGLILRRLPEPNALRRLQ